MRNRRHLTRAAAIVLVLVLTCGAARADEVTSKGTLLRGKVTGLGGAGITFEPEYGTGAIAIKWADIETVRTDAAFQVLYGDDQEVDAPLVSFSAGKVMVGTTAVDAATIYAGLPLGPGGVGFNERMRSAFRYWDGTFDIGLNVQQATTDTTGFLVAFGTVRTKDPTRLTIAAAYRYGTEKKQGETKSTTQDQLLGVIREDYSFTPRVYGYASGDATYDGIQRLSIRGVPKAGVGYVFWDEKLDETRRNFFQGDVGGAWIYEKYFTHDFTMAGTPPVCVKAGCLSDPHDRNYFAIAFGARAGYYLPYGAHFDWMAEYLPAVDNFTTDYLLRTQGGVTVPLIDPVSAKIIVRDEYNSRPASGSERNSLFLTLALSVAW